MRIVKGLVLAIALAASGAGAAVVADSLPFTGTPAWSDVTFVNTSMGIVGGETVISTFDYQGVWFGWLGSQNPPGWSIASNADGNYLSLTAKFSANAADWNAYMSDGTRFAEMLFNPTGCNSNLAVCYGLPTTAGVKLVFAGALPGSVAPVFVPLDTTRYNHFEWLLRGNTVTYRVNGVAYTGAARGGGGSYLIIGDDSGSNPTGVGQMRIAGVSFDAAPAFDNLPTEAIPEPANWALLLTGFGLIGATLRRRRALFA